VTKREAGPVARGVVRSGETAGTQETRHYEEEQNQPLRDGERRLATLGGKGMKRRDFLEGLTAPIT
jgi:hypothetical protein